MKGAVKQPTECLNMLRADVTWVNDTRPIKGCFRLRWPDGEVQSVKLPKAAGVGLGCNANVMLVWPRAAPVEKQHLILLWLRRVKGGWMPIES